MTRRFGATLALRQVSTAFQAGTLTFLEGPNGAGKSTLLAIVGTVLRPNSGSVWYEPLGDNQELARRHIGCGSRTIRTATASFSGRRNIELVGQIHGVSQLPQQVERVLARVGAEAFADRPVGTLSRGQRQRIALARALVHAPGVLLLDEPWTGSSASVEQLEAVIREEVARGSLVIAVTHGAGTAERLGARRVRIEGGQRRRQRRTRQLDSRKRTFESSDVSRLIAVDAFA